MLTIFILLVLCHLTSVCGDGHQLSSKLRAEQLEKIRCGYDLKPLWTAEVAHSPFAATPLIADVDADGHVDVVASPFTESFTVLSGRTGKTLENSGWPALNLDSSFHASPLQFDIDGDGLLDLLFITSSAEMLFYSASGIQLINKHLQLPPVRVAREWYNEAITVSIADIKDFVLGRNQDLGDNGAKYISVDPHVLATPVIADLNRDGHVEELIVPISYYFEEEDYRDPEKVLLLGMRNQSELNNFLVAGLSVVNLTNLEILWTKHLEVSKILSAYPAFMLNSPTVIDLDSNGSALEIVVGSSGGNIYVFDLHGNNRDGFPSSSNSIHGQITVADINNDGALEMISVDMSGITRCTDIHDNLIWEVETSGESSSGSRLFDVNHDGVLDVIVTTNLGDVYVLDGSNGSVIPGWPFQVGHRIVANVLITKVSRMRPEADMVFIADDGIIYVLSLDLKCKAHFSVGETSLVQILSHDLISQSEGLELLVATSDGAIICLGSGSEPEEKFVDEYEQNSMPTLPTHFLPAETKTINDFSFSNNKPLLYLTEWTRMLGEVTGSRFWIEVEIRDHALDKNIDKTYKITLQVYFGRNLLYTGGIHNSGLHYIYITAWPHPCHGHVIVMMTNQHGQVFKDGFALRFNQVILQDLQWLLLAPFLAMVIILLLLHGFPAKDLLPYLHHSKT